MRLETLGFPAAAVLPYNLIIMHVLSKDSKLGRISIFNLQSGRLSKSALG
jgi:hypothetical protein